MENSLVVLHQYHKDEWYVYHSDLSWYVSDCTVPLIAKVFSVKKLSSMICVLHVLLNKTTLCPIYKVFWLNMSMKLLLKKHPIKASYPINTIAATIDKVYQLLGHGRWFSPGTPASSTTKPGRHDITEILLKVTLKH